jgi:hypothetical protein
VLVHQQQFGLCPIVGVKAWLWLANLAVGGDVHHDGYELQCRLNHLSEADSVAAPSA